MGGSTGKTIAAYQNPLDKNSPMNKALDATINKQQIEARKAAEALAAQQLAMAEEQRRMFEERQKTDQDATAKAESGQETARQQQKKKSLAAGGRQGTILTSPLGVTAPAQKAGKTILGA